jgi:hypothetical protein
MNQSKGKQLYYSKELSSSRVGDKPSNVLEKEVNHVEDKLFCKYFENKNGKKTKVLVIAPGSGGEYKLVVIKDGDKQESTHSKSELMAYLKKNKHLDFMLKYINSATSLSRPKSRKTKSRSKTKKTKSRSKSRTKKTKSRSKSRTKKTKSRSKSRTKKTKSRSKKRTRRR